MPVSLPGRVLTRGQAVGAGVSEPGHRRCHERHIDVLPPVRAASFAKRPTNRGCGVEGGEHIYNEELVTHRGSIWIAASGHHTGLRLENRVVARAVRRPACPYAEIET